MGMMCAGGYLLQGPTPTTFKLYNTKRPGENWNTYTLRTEQNGELEYIKFDDSSSVKRMKCIKTAADRIKFLGKSQDGTGICTGNGDETKCIHVQPDFVKSWPMALSYFQGFKTRRDPHCLSSFIMKFTMEIVNRC